MVGIAALGAASGSSDDPTPVDNEAPVAKNEDFQAHIGGIRKTPAGVHFRTPKAEEAGVRFLKRGEFTPADKRSINKALSIHKPKAK